MSDRQQIWLCAVLGTVLVAAVAYPALRPPAEDGYPLSTYPMFSRDRGRSLRVASARLRYEDGHEETLPPTLIANGEVMQAVQRLNRGLRRGRKGRKRLCRQIASRVAMAGTERQQRARELLLVQERVDTVTFLSSRGDPSAPAAAGHKRRVRARCELGSKP